METHYNNPKLTSLASVGKESSEGVGVGANGVSSESNTVDETTRPRADNSGLKLFYTTKLRKHDAGVLSIGKCISNLWIIFKSLTYLFRYLPPN